MCIRDSSYYITQLYLVLFFSYIVPITIPVTIVLFILHYWSDKYTLFKRSSVATPLSFGISMLVVRLSEYSLVFFTGGNLYFSSRLLGEVKWMNIIPFVFTLLYTFMITIFPKAISKICCGDPNAY